MKDNDIKKKTVTGFFWRFAERTGDKIVKFIVEILLARFLLPEDYGVVALVTVFINILQVFVDSGLGTALIQKKNSDDLDFSSVFYFNMAMCIVCYLLLFFFAPYIAQHYRNNELTAIVRVIGLTLLVSGVKNIQQSYVSKNLLFRRFFFATLGGTIFSAIIGIWFAYLGYGPWAIVAQHLSNTFIDTLILWITVKWRPRKVFSWIRLKSLLRFGWKLMVSALINTVFENVRSLIIGKQYTSADLGYYNRGKQFPSTIVTNINNSIDSVLLPAMSIVQDNNERLKSITRRSIKTSSYIMWPLMIGLVVCAKPLVSLLLTDKWLPCVPFLQIFSVAFTLYPIHTANLNAINALGRSDVFLKLEIAKKTVGILSIIITVPLGVFAIACGYLITGPIGVVINAYPNKKLLNYSITEQIRDILPSIFLSIVMGLVIYPIQFLPISNWLVLLMQVTCGVLIYWIGSKLFKFEEYTYLKNMAIKAKDRFRI